MLLRLYTWSNLGPWFKYTKVILENLTDYNMMLFHERDKPGGIAGIMGTRHVKENNKYLKNYDENSDNIFLEYFDANNLYGLAMSQFLPTGGHKWISKEKKKIT